MITSLPVIDLIGIVVVALRLAILVALAMFIYTYSKVTKYEIKVMMMQTIVICFVVSLFLMISQSLTFRVLTLLDRPLGEVQNALFVLVVTSAVFILLVYARHVYRKLIEFMEREDSVPTIDDLA